MSDEERLVALANDLVRAWSEDRVAEVELDREDAIELTASIHAGMERLTAARAAAAEAASLRIACQPGCSACCENLVMVFRGEALNVAEWLSLPDNAAAREQFLDNYPRWREAVGDAPERATRARRDHDEQALVAAALDVFRRGVMCALNHEGMCLAYVARPNTCRNCHALDTNQHCTPATDRPPDTVQVEELDQFRQGMRPLNEAVHEALGGEPGVQVALCDEVYRLLDQ